MFQVARFPLMLGVLDPKLLPGASLGFVYATPGNTRSSEMTSRPRSATCSSCVDVISAECSELVVCTIGLTAVIVTLSATEPTFN